MGFRGLELQKKAEHKHSDKYVRLECIRLAILDKPPHAELRTDRVIERADEFYHYAMDIMPEKK